jgi:NADH:ubiquinone oxidoreductase subunit F (NADH-binding)
MLSTIIEQMEGNCFCLLGEFVVPGVRTSLKLFGPEYEALAINEESDSQPQKNLVHLYL